MARLYFFVEGQTEQTFASNVLAPHLANFGVYLEGPVLIATARRKGKVHRGGGRHYLPMKNEIVRLLKRQTGADVFVTTMIDLYALFSDFPGTHAAAKQSHLTYERVRTLEEAFASDVSDARLIPHIQLHEFETLLFVEPKWLEFFYDNHPAAIMRLEAIAAPPRTSPDLIDDGPQTAPSKRIIKEFPEYADANPTVGPQVAELIGIPAIRAKCPHFDQWLKRLENLAVNAASPHP